MDYKEDLAISDKRRIRHLLRFSESNLEHAISNLEYAKERMESNGNLENAERVKKLCEEIDEIYSRLSPITNDFYK